MMGMNLPDYRAASYWHWGICRAVVNMDVLC